MADGWIKIHRKVLEWEWFRESKMVHIFLYLLLNANTQPCTWQGTKLKRGQLIRGYRRISCDTGLSIQEIRTCMKRLEKSEVISRTTVRNTTEQGSLITILKYAQYQQTTEILQQTSNRPATDLQQTSNIPATQDKERKEREKDIISNDVLEPATQDELDSLRQKVEELTEQLNTPKKKKPNPLITQGRKVFESRYSELFDGSSYYWQAKDSVAMESLTKKIIHSRKEKGMDVGEQEVISALRVFISSIEDTWILRNFSVPNINSKYNELVAQARSNINNNQHGIINNKKAERASGAAAIIARLAEKEASDANPLRR